MTALERPGSLVIRLARGRRDRGASPPIPVDYVHEDRCVIAAALEAYAVTLMSIPPRNEEDARIAFGVAAKLLQFSREIGGAS